MSEVVPINNYRTKTSAAGQLAGYTLQYFRALLRLLQCEIDEAVSVERLGDVSVHKNDGQLLLEEDKSSITDNPASDLSIDLWKTLYNWIQFLVESNTDVSKCRFVLYVLSPVAPRPLLDKFNAVRNQKTANDAILEATTIIANSSSKEIARYANAVLEKNRKIFQQLLMRLDVETNEREIEIEEEIRNQLRKYSIQENRLDELKNHYLGWLITRINGDIRANNCPIIYKDEFLKENMAFVNSIRSNSLVDYSSSDRPTEEELAAEAVSDKVYVKQLQAIEIGQAKMIQACSDYLRVSINRQQWIENELISPEEADEFESKLCSAYEREKERIELEASDSDDVKKGRLLLNACEGQQVRISDRDPVDRTIPGTYHHLSDDRRVGWHPKWKSLFCKGEKNI